MVGRPSARCPVNKRQDIEDNCFDQDTAILLVRRSHDLLPVGHSCHHTVMVAGTLIVYIRQRRMDQQPGACRCQRVSNRDSPLSLCVWSLWLDIKPSVVLWLNGESRLGPLRGIHLLEILKRTLASLGTYINGWELLLAVIKWCALENDSSEAHKGVIIRRDMMWVKKSLLQTVKIQDSLKLCSRRASCYESTQPFP